MLEQRIVTPLDTPSFGLASQTDKTLPPVLSNSHSAILAVINGEKDLTFSASRPFKNEMDETKKKCVELVCVPFAKDAFVFVQNRFNPVRSLTAEQYRQVFSGRRTGGDCVFDLPFCTFYDERS